jgi:hypothetical protein
VRVIQNEGVVGASTGSLSRGRIPYAPGSQIGVDQGTLGETPAASSDREQSTSGGTNNVGLASHGVQM